MNKAVLMGRLTADPDIRYSQGEKSICIARFTLAVDRRFKREGDQSADFIRCAVFGKLAEHVEKYYHKGMKTCLEGRIQTGSYTNNEGQKIYTTEVIVENMEFAESKAASAGSVVASSSSSSNKTTAGYSQPTEGPAGYDGFMNIPDGIDEELPFT